MTKQKKMDPRWKREWAAALRSGEYKQGRGTLKQLRGSEMVYCCIGVLCEVAKLPSERRTKRKASEHIFRDGESWSHEYIPYPERFGLVEADPVIASVGAPLSVINDASGLSFSDIADLIERNL